MRPVQTFTIVPSLPPRLERLRALAYNLYWSWDHDARDLFRRLDRKLWEETRHNPVLMLAQIDQERLESAAADVGFLSHYDRVLLYGGDLETRIRQEMILGMGGFQVLAARITADGLPHERGALGLFSPRADPPPDEGAFALLRPAAPSGAGPPS
ncbi:MAG TPA: DUF3417 domain-containing protein [Candidatus Manganitrophaceae bacterium]